MLCIIGVQLIFIGIFKFWPFEIQDSEDKYFVAPNQEIFVEQSIATKQETAPASPPKPQIPIPVPSDEVIEEDIEIMDFNDLLSFEKIGEGEVGQTGDSDEAVASPEKPPSPLKITEPATPKEARDADIIAEVFITFLVTKTGEVEDIYISSIRKYKPNRKDFEIVDDIGYGIIRVSLDAANKWRFNPAKDNGVAVKAYTTQVFSFGF